MAARSLTQGSLSAASRATRHVRTWSLRARRVLPWKTCRVVELTEDERAILRRDLLDWGGPANPTVALVRVMGFESIGDLHESARRIADVVWTGAALSRRDWTRALVATEFVWASEVFGSGLDSVYTFGYSDAEAVALLRSVQRELRKAGAAIGGVSLT
jgi:hypothetical protein